MTDTFTDTILNMTDTAATPEDYTGEDGLLYCGKCRQPKEAYFPEGKRLFGRDRHPRECDCQRAAREEREAAEENRRHREEVEKLKRRGFTDPAHTRIYDRLLEMCCPVCVTGENFRKATAQAKMERLKMLLNGKEICL